MKKLMMTAVAALAAGMSVAAELVDDENSRFWSPVGLGLTAKWLQWPSTDSDVLGFRFGGFFGCNSAVRGFDLGVAERSDTFMGLQVAGFTWTDGIAYGCRLSWLGNVTYGETRGFEFAPANVAWADFSGVQLGAVNYESAMVGGQVAALLNWNTLASRGFQLAPVNVSPVRFSGWEIGGLNWAGETSGLQCGFVNLAETVRGVQIGVVNAADDIRGIQIGVFNVISVSPLPIMVIANGRF